MKSKRIAQPSEQSKGINVTHVRCVFCRGFMDNIHIQIYHFYFWKINVCGQDHLSGTRKIHNISDIKGDTVTQSSRNVKGAKHIFDTAANNTNNHSFHMRLTVEIHFELHQNHIQ